MITLERLIAISVIVSTGSFTAASRKLSISASAVSQIISNFEIELGYPLFHRTMGSRPKLTDFGKYIYFQALEILPYINNIKDKVASLELGEDISLTIAVHPFVFKRKYSDLINVLMKKFPFIILNITDFDDNHNNPDVAIGPMTLMHTRECESYIIDKINWRFAISKEHNLSKKLAMLSLSDLNCHFQILPSKNKFLNEDLIESMRFSPKIITCSHLYQMENLILSGAGFGLCSYEYIEHRSFNDQLLILPVDIENGRMEWPIEMTWSRNLGPVGLWFVNLLMEMADFETEKIAH